MKLHTVRKGWKRSRIAILSAVLFCVVQPVWVRAGGPSRPDHEVKAAYLPLFTKFVTWPSNAFAGAQSPLLIGVLGEGLPGRTLEDEALKAGSTGGWSISVVRSNRIEDLKDCQILFVSKSEMSRMAAILKACEGRSVLIVGEWDGCAASGGVINFFIRDSKVRMEINIGEARKRSLKISSQLLGVAKIIGKAE